MSAAASRTFRAPRLYLQGPGVIERACEIASELGRRPALITDSEVVAILGTRLAEILRPLAPGIEPIVLDGEITASAADVLAERARGADVVVAAGGGRVIDAGKAVAWRLGAALLVVPTIASCNAATSRGAVLHEADGEVTVERNAWNPHAVLVDTAIIAAAPARFLRCGIGDALAASFELEACAAAGAESANGGITTIAAAALADACYATVRRLGREALDAVEAGVADDALEAVVEAALLLSGLGFEGGGLSIAHSVAITLALTPGLDRAAHGEQVAYGLQVQLALDEGDERLLDIAGFCAEVGLPRTLEMLGASNAGEAEIQLLARQTMSAPWVANHPLKPGHDELAAALRRVERAGREPAANGS
jgi:glycerol dehydrogenase